MNFSLQDVINTLNNIEIRGKDNMDKMLGAILALESILAEQNMQQEEDKGE